MAIFTRTGGRVLFLLVLGAFVLVSSPLVAQITRGAISGVVRDPSGLVVPGATVTVTNDDTKTSQNTVSDVEGFYRVAALEPGRYTVRVELQSFATVEARDIVVPPSTEVRVPVELKVGSVTETVSVTANAVAAALNKTSPTIGVTIGSKQIVELPLSGGRNINNLILTAPNVSMAGFTANAGQGTYIVNGQRSRNNNYMIDGSDNNDISVTISTASVVPESVAEFQVLTNPYSVEFGRNSGGQINVITKSGGDRFKGDLWDYYTTSKFYSLTNLEKASGLTEPARFYRHQAGGDIGGPIVKGKTFFYGLFQYDPQRPGPTPGTTTVRVPTPTGFAVLSAAPLGAGQTAASRQAVLARLAFLNDVYASGATFRTLTNTLVNGVPIETGLTNVNIISPSTYKTVQFRIDQKISNSDNVTFRELYNPKIDENVAGFNCAFGAAFCGNQDLKDQNFAASETHLFNSAQINEFRFSAVRRNLDFPENDPKSPTATISGLFTIGGLANFPQSRLSNAYQFSDTFTWTKSRHTIKAGADIRYNVLDNVAAFDSKGTFTFDNLQNYMNNFATTFQQALQTASFTAKQWQSFLFVQDDFRVTPELTVNLGLRYEVSGVPLGFFGATDAQSLAALVPGPVQRDTNNWAPRVGAAWSPGSSNKVIGNGKSVFRAGFGIGYDILFYNLLTVNGSNYPNVVVPQQFNVQNLYPNVSPLTGAAVFDPTGVYTNSEADTQNPESRYYSASWQRDIGDVLLEVGYTGSRGYKGINQWQMNPAVLTAAQAALVASTRNANAIPGVQARRIFPLFGSRVAIPAYTGPNGVDAEARSVYNAVYFSANKRISHGLQVAGSYTYSSLYSNNDASLGEGGTDGSSQRPQSFFDIASEWSVSQFDRPHRFTSSYSWEIPGPKSGVLSQVLGGWQWTGVTQIQSGRPFTIGTGVDSNGDGATGSDRPNVNPSGTIVWDDQHASFVNNGYYAAPLGTNGLPLTNALGNGNALRNSERGARFLKTDFSLIKNFRVGGGRVILVRADLLNAFKNPDYGIPVPNMSSPSFGQNTNNWGRRSVQVSAKVTF